MDDYRPFSLRMHPLNDLVGLSLLLLSPWLLGFSANVAATRFTVALVAVGMGLNLVTDYPLDVVRKLLFKWHERVELASPPLFIAAPWYFVADAGMMPWVANAIGLLAVVKALLRAIPARHAA